jgi:hypothetical protein
MAGRLLNRRELRKQADSLQVETSVTNDASVPVLPKVKAPRAAAKRKPRAKKEPLRLRARWGVFDGSMKQVAIFDYNQRPAADAKLADLQANRKGLFFLQIVKEPMPEVVPLETSPQA